MEPSETERPRCLILSTSLPDLTPQKSAALTSSFVVRLRAKVPVREISAWERRSRRTET